MLLGKMVRVRKQSNVKNCMHSIIFSKHFSLLTVAEDWEPIPETMGRRQDTPQSITGHNTHTYIHTYGQPSISGVFFRCGRKPVNMEEMKPGAMDLWDLNSCKLHHCGALCQRWQFCNKRHMQHSSQLFMYGIMQISAQVVLKGLKIYNDNTG